MPFLLIAASHGAPGKATTLSVADELTAIFRPFNSPTMALSPDGQYVAYTDRRGDDLFLMLRDLENTTLRRQFVATAQRGDASGLREKIPATITFLRWAAKDRLVFNVNGQNVWSIAADADDARRLGDVNTYAAALPPPETVEVVTPIEDLPEYGIVVMPVSALEAVRDTIQPVNVAAMLRGDRFVYLEAKMKEREFIREFSLGDRETHRATPIRSGAPRVVLRTDIATGKQTEWGEAPDSEFLLCDQDGRPRVVAQSRHLPNSGSLTTEYAYADAKGSKWDRLDDLVGPASPLHFHLRPDNQLGQRSVPLGFGYDPDILFFASNVGRDTFGVYGLNTKTWQRTDLAIETPISDLIDPLARTPDSDALILDPWKRKLVGLRYIGVERSTLWFDAELQGIQRNLNAVAPNRRWEIIEWDRLRRNFLVVATSNIEPGVFYLYRPGERTLDEIANRAPWLNEAVRNPSVSFGFQTKAGVNISGYLTHPRRSRLKVPPLVVLLHDGPWDRDRPGYNREVQALASMGFTVLQVNYRGSAGFGQKHLHALREGYDRVALDDILAAVAAVPATYVDRRLIAVMGRGYGGYLALRALQLHPRQFRCGIALDAPSDLPTWLTPPPDDLDSREVRSQRWDEGGEKILPYSPSQDNKTLLTFDPPEPVPVLKLSYVGEMRRMFFNQDGAKLSAISPLTQPDLIAAPVMIIQSDANGIGRGGELARALKRLEREVEYVSLNAEAAADLPNARAALFRQINEFLNVNIYNYAVKIGEVVEKK